MGIIGEVFDEYLSALLYRAGNLALTFHFQPSELYPMDLDDMDMWLKAGRKVQADIETQDRINRLRRR